MNDEFRVPSHYSVKRGELFVAETETTAPIVQIIVQKPYNGKEFEYESESYGCSYYVKQCYVYRAHFYKSCFL